MSGHARNQRMRRFSLSMRMLLAKFQYRNAWQDGSLQLMAQIADNATMRLTTATHTTDVLGLSYFGSRRNEYSLSVNARRTKCNDWHVMVELLICARRAFAVCFFLNWTFHHHTLPFHASPVRIPLTIGFGQPLAFLSTPSNTYAKCLVYHMPLIRTAATSTMPLSTSYGSKTRALRLRIYLKHLALESGIMRDNTL